MSALTRPLVGARPTRLAAVFPSRDRLRVLTGLVTIVAVAFAFLLIAGVAGIMLYGVSHTDQIYEGVSIAGQPVGGMTRAEAASLMEQHFQEYGGKSISLVADGQSFQLMPADLGADVDGAASAARAYDFGRTGSLWNRSQSWAGALLHHRSVPLVVSFDEAMLRGTLENIGASVVRAPSDAYVDMASGDEPVVVTEESGLSIDATTTRARMLNRVANLSYEDVPIQIVHVPPAVAATDLEGALPDAAAAVGSSLTLQAAEGSWVVEPEQLRSIVSVAAGSDAIVIDRGAVERLVGGIAVQIDRPAADAGITVDEKGDLALVPAVDSRQVDQGATTDSTVTLLAQGQHVVDIAVKQSEPSIVDEQAEAGLAEAKALIGDGIDLVWKGGAATIGRDELIAALTITPRPDEDDPFLFGFDAAVVQQSLANIATEIDDPAENAKFRLVNGEVTLVSDAKNGRLLDRKASLEAILSALFDAKSEVTLSVVADTAKYTAKDVSGISVPDLLADSSTYYGDSSEPRRHNVERAVELEEGWLIAPGDVFSYVEIIGDITKANDFVTGFGIVADEERGGVTTAPVIGGGICQVSTTIFQAAFWAGMPIIERYQHPYWIRTYGEGPQGMQGLDAMVNVEDDWALDLKFENATDDWIAVAISADGERVTTRILGTDPKWDVVVDQPKITNVTPQDDNMYYTESSELPRGQELQVEHAQLGFDAVIHREVRSKDGEVIDNFVLESSYAASRNTMLKGTGASD